MQLEMLLIGGIAVLGVCLASVTLVLLFAWHRNPPSVAALQADLDALHGSHTDLADRVHHWFRRESTRKARKKKEENYDARVQAAPAQPGDHKAQLRARLAASRFNQ